MSIYDVNYSALVPNILPPNKRLPRFMQYLRDLVFPVQWSHDAFFDDYADGSVDPIWVSTLSYTIGDRVISWYPFDANINDISNTSYTMGQPRSNSVYECEVDVTTLNDVSAGTWPVLSTPEQDKGIDGRLVSNVSGGLVVGVGIASGGTGYGQAAWVNFIQGGGSNAAAVLNYDGNSLQAGSVTLSLGAITGLSLTGASLQPTPYKVPPTVMFKDFTGSGAKVVPILTNGIVTGFTIIDGGTGYTAPTVFIFGGTTTGAGTITSVTVVDGGSGYTSPPQALVSSQWFLVTQDFRGARSRAHYNSRLGTLTWILNEWFHTVFRNFNPIGAIGLYGWGTGDSATATATQMGGVITSIAVTFTGSGYATAPYIFISDPTGTGATATAIMSYPNWSPITAYSIGDFVVYFNATYQAIANNTGDNPATTPASWTLVSNNSYTGAVQSITIQSGGTGYTNPTVQIIVPGVTTPPGGGTGPFQQLHSDIFITPLNEISADIFYTVPIETDPVVSYVIPLDAGNPGYGGQPIQYIQGSTQASINDFIVWVPYLTFWAPILAQGNNPEAVVRHVVDQYALAGLHYSVLYY